MTENGIILLVLMVALLVIIWLLIRAKQSWRERLEHSPGPPNPPADKPVSDGSIVFFSSSPGTGRWQCINCQVENEPGTTRCILCGRARQGG